ncbi:MAG: MoaD/ThiS family protein [Dehalococcoidales bacterium]|jgi:molybdopterin converting factor small subunit|nr:hypothetical protein [Dehalococcoidales bacterium]MDP6127841.1 MoaD/ThiS family protein [Dehalococcoidales bacterium]MDP6501183.1 MoaD/ThiS family protein [Dehalococcoidales bacterium]MDP6632217.1 MoaD/ThiS family protein [Dehalococcoidales bacterium]|tara:strand:- start:149 stop:430 length:282 start_codon:yes stop_codon:yes gene_type:complete
MIKCIVEMYGLSREVSGVQQVEIKLEGGNSLRDAVAALRREIPSLDGSVIRRGEDRLEDDGAFNINGHFYLDHEELKLEDGDHLRLLSLATGG